VANMRTERRKVKPQQPSADGFTLIEMLTVVAIIALLFLMVIGGSSWYQRTTSLNRARITVTSLDAAIESYKADMGTYPTSSLVRVSYYELFRVSSYTNSWLLYQQLTQGRGYYKFQAAQIQSPAMLPLALWGGPLPCPNMTTIIDPWGLPYHYFNPLIFTNQNPVWAASPSCGKTNMLRYDLWSRGPDRTEDTVDDITNWTR